MSSSIVIFSLIIPLCCGLLELRKSTRSGSLLLVGLLVTLGVQLYAFLSFKEPLFHRWEWIPGYQLSFQYDAVPALLSLLVLIISSVVVYYGGWYMEGDGRKHHFFAFLGFFISTMLGLVLAKSLLLIFIF